MVKLYLDQMIRVEIADLLRQEGFDVLRASEAGQARSDDKAIMERVIAEQRVLVTLDEHFGDWSILPLKAHPGVIRLKIHPPTVEGLWKYLLPLIKRHPPADFINRLVIVGTRRERWIATAS